MEVIVAEDEAVTQKLLIKLLEKIGYTVYLANTGKQAWEMFKKKRVKLVISDWMMPEMDGLELCRKIRDAATPYYVYLIVLTTKTKKEDLVKVFHAGADDFVPKPFDSEELKYRVKTGARIINLEERHTTFQTIIKESRNKIRVVFDALQECIVAIDDQYQIVSANKSFFDEVDEETGTVIGSSFFSTEVEKDLPWGNRKIQKITDKVFSKGKTEHFLEKSVDETGIARYFNYFCLPIMDSSQKVLQVVVVSRDITDDIEKTNKIKALNDHAFGQKAQIEKKNKKLEQTLKKLEDTQAQILQSEKMASIGQLSAGVAHEINNPTGFVSSNLKTLVDYQNDLNKLILLYQKLMSEMEEKYKESISSEIQTVIDEIKTAEEDMDVEFIQEDIMDLIGDCREGMDRIKKIVIDLKDFAHPGEDKVQDIDINYGLESTLNVVSNELKYIATVKKDFGDIPQVKAYPQQLNQVFMNILVNAAQAMEKKGEIRIKTRAIDAFVEIVISDTGIGIPEDNLSKIYDPFFTTKDVGKGTGLGMNIVYNIIKKHNGSIDVESEVGKGTTFTIKLPRE